MDSETHVDVRRILDMLDELDALYANSIDQFEGRLAGARTAIEQAISNEKQPTNGVTAGGIDVQTQSDHDAMLGDMSKYMQRINELESLLADMAKKDARLAELEAIAEEIGKRDNEIAELSGNNQQLKAQLVAAQSTASDIGRAHSRIEQLEQQVQEREDQLDTYREQLMKAENHLAERDAQISALEERQAQTEQAHQALEERCASLTASHDAERKSIEYLESEREELRKEVESHQARHTEHEANVAALDTEREALAKALKAQEDKAEAQTTAFEALQSEYDALNYKFTHYKESRDAEIAALNGRLQATESADERIAALQQALDERTAQTKELEAVLTDVEQQRDKLELELKMVLDQVASFQYQQDEMEQMQRRIDKLSAELEAERATVIRLNAQLAAPGRARAFEPAPAPEESLEISKARAVTEVSAGKGRRQRKQMGEILAEAGVITKEQLEEVIRLKASDPKRRFGGIVVERGYASEEVIAAALAAQLRIRYIESLEREMEIASVNLVPHQLVKHHRCVPVYSQGGQLLIAMANPLDLIAIDDIELATNARVEPAVATPKDIEYIIEKYYEREQITTPSTH